MKKTTSKLLCKLMTGVLLTVLLMPLTVKALPEWEDADGDGVIDGVTSLPKVTVTEKRDNGGGQIGIWVEIPGISPFEPWAEWYGSFTGAFAGSGSSGSGSEGVGGGSVKLTPVVPIVIKNGNGVGIALNVKITAGTVGYVISNGKGGYDIVVLVDRLKNAYGVEKYNQLQLAMNVLIDAIEAHEMQHAIDAKNAYDDIFNTTVPNAMLGYGDDWTEWKMEISAYKETLRILYEATESGIYKHEQLSAEEIILLNDEILRVENVIKSLENKLAKLGPMP